MLETIAVGILDCLIMMILLDSSTNPNDGGVGMSSCKLLGFIPYEATWMVPISTVNETQSTYTSPQPGVCAF